MKYLGCAYYPEYWGRERFEVDAKLMKEAEINVVRIGEFAWSRMEPEEGNYTLEWLHECIETFEMYNIDIIMCTPTAAPPAWLTFAYPDTLLVKKDGSKSEHGARRHYCYSSDTYIRHTQAIVEKLSFELSRHKNIIAWQIDNEPDFAESGICYCETCQSKFQAWLKTKYKTINELNKKWRTGFWSMDYTDWRQVRLGLLDGQHYTSRALDTRRFASMQLANYILLQKEIIKKNQPTTIVSTNLNGSIFCDVNFNIIFSQMDIAMKDLYFDICTMDKNALILDQFRSFKLRKNFWITETGAGMCGNGKPSNKDQFKAWMWSSFVRGADAYVVFRWRTCLSGQEQELEGILEHSGHPGHRYKKVQSAFSEMKEISSKIGSIPFLKADVAIIHDYDVMWGYKSASISKEIDYENNFSAIYKELYKKSIPVDILNIDSCIDGYKLIILPSLVIIDEKFAEKLKHYVEKGGTLFAQGQIGMRDRNFNYIDTKGPKYLNDLLGINIIGGMYLYSMTEVDESWSVRNYLKVDVNGFINDKNIAGKVSTWIGDIELKGAQKLLSFSESDYKNQPILTQNQFGSGVSIYAAAITFEESLFEEIFSYLIIKSKINCYRDIPMHVEIIERDNYLFIINHLNKEVTINVERGKTAILGDYSTDGTLKIKPYGVTILELTIK